MISCINPDFIVKIALIFLLLLSSRPRTIVKSIEYISLLGKLKGLISILSGTEINIEKD
jgi:hypothetical protein